MVAERIPAGKSTAVGDARGGHGSCRIDVCGTVKVETLLGRRDGRVRPRSCGWSVGGIGYQGVNRRKELAMVRGKKSIKRLAAGGVET